MPMKGVPGVFRAMLVSFVLGVALGSFSYEVAPTGALLVLACAAAMFGAWPDRRGFVFLLLGASLAFGWLHTGAKERFWRDIPDIGVVSGVAEIVSAPNRRDFSQDAIVFFRSCYTGPCPTERVSVRFPLSADVSFGDSGTLSCTLSLPEEAWRMYHAKEGVSHVCVKPTWDRRGSGDGVASVLMRFSGSFERSLAQALPEPESSFAAGLLLGGEGRLPSGVKDDFRAAGLAHIVAVSGYNISIIAGYLLLAGIVVFLPRKRAAIFALLGTLAFVFVAGSPPSAVRAVGMAATLILAWALGRRYASLSALLFAAAAMLAWNPLLLRHDVGFLLSFAATVGIVFATPFIGRALRDVAFFPKVFLEALLITIAAELFILPIIFASFGHFSFIAFPANALLLPLVPLAMLLSFLSGIGGLLFEPLGTILGFPAYAVLHAIVSGSEYAASFKQADVVWDAFGWKEAIIWYAVLIGIIMGAIRLRRRRTGFPGLDQNMPR